MTLANFITSLLAISFLLGCEEKLKSQDSQDMSLPVQKLDFDTMEIDAEPSVLDVDMD